MTRRRWAGDRRLLLLLLCLCLVDGCTAFNQTGLNSTQSQSCEDNHDCQNNGTCRPDQGFGTGCSCTPWFEGRYCQTRKKTPCLSNPCKNGATCWDWKEASEGSDVWKMMCICESAGYTGKLCETDVDECKSQPCKNDGTCEDKLSGYTCSCKPETTGELCQYVFCSENPCRYGGTCVLPEKAGTNYTCLCAPGNTGHHCQSDIDECASNPCSEPGTMKCYQGPDFFGCQCFLNYTGDLCENQVLTTKEPTLQASPTPRPTKPQKVELGGDLSPLYMGMIVVAGLLGLILVFGGLHRACAPKGAVSHWERLQSPNDVMPEGGQDGQHQNGSLNLDSISDEGSGHTNPASATEEQLPIQPAVSSFQPPTEQCMPEPSD